jgi:hypothetical protein
MWATPNTNSPSATFGPSLTSVSSFGARLALGAIVDVVVVGVGGVVRWLVVRTRRMWLEGCPRILWLRCWLLSNPVVISDNDQRHARQVARAWFVTSRFVIFPSLYSRSLSPNNHLPTTQGVSQPCRCQSQEQKQSVSVVQQQVPTHSHLFLQTNLEANMRRTLKVGGGGTWGFYRI